MVKNEILAKLWDSKEVNDAISKMQPEELQYDLKAEIFLLENIIFQFYLHFLS